MSFFKKRTADYELPEANDDIYNLIAPHSRVLDIGCADGKLSERLKKERKCFTVGIEYDKDLSVKAREKYDKFIEADISKLPSLPFSDNSFDYIVFADILEHIPNPDEVLTHFKKYLKEWGYILISIPNVAYWQIRLKLLLGDFDYNHPILDGGHLRFFTLRSANELLEDSGFKITYLVNRNNRIKILGRLFKSLFAFQFIIKARKI